MMYKIEKIQEQAKEKMEEGGGDKKSNNYRNRVSPNGEKRSDTKIHTDKELAKMAGVGTGTVAYDTKEEVMEWMLDIQLERRNLLLSRELKLLKNIGLFMRNKH